MIPDGPLPVPENLAQRVTEATYAGLLGYPDGRLPAGRSAALARQSRDRFGERSRPWARVRTVGIDRIAGEAIALGNAVTLTSGRLARRLGEIAADRLVVAMVSSGAEVDATSAALWQDDRPDEAYFLDRFGAAAAVYLAAWTGDHLRKAARRGHLGLGPGYSPGYDGWDLTDQIGVARCLTRPAIAAQSSLPGPFRVLESGMLEPKNSLLAVFGAGSEREAAERQWRRHRCSWCSLDGCNLRGRRSQSPTIGP